jgi:hypothetical protein
MKKIHFIVLAILLFGACKSNDQNQESSSTTANTATTNTGDNKPVVITHPIDTIQKLSDSFTGDSAYMKVSDNKFIIVYAATDSLENFERITFGPSCPSVNDDIKCKSDTFEGCVRGKVKTTMLTNTNKTFPTIKELLADLNSVSSDEVMKAKDISGTEDSKREPEEKRNVLIKKAFLYTIYREPDNDFHIIIGDSPKFSESVFLNIEVSGTPRGASATVINKFMKVRNKIKNHPNIGDLKCNSVRSLKASPFLITDLSGSLFFDDQHSAGSVGQGDAKPKTAWEIHPVKNMTIAGAQ